MREMLLAVLAGLLVANPARAQFGGGVVICPTCNQESTQWVVHAEQVLQYGILVQQLADLIYNSTKGRAASMTNIAADVGALASAVQGGRALAYSLGNQDVLFRQTYPGYVPPLGASWPASGTYANRYQIWARTSLDTTAGIMRGAGIQGRLLATEQGVLSVLRALAASNLLPRNLAISLTSQLAAEQVAQAQKLREIALEDLQSKAAFQGYQLQKDADMVSTEQRFFGAAAITPGDSRVFPTVP
jgi:P-type conjugative transfer protein TrbJ